MVIGKARILMTPKTYSTTEINAVAGTGWCPWRLNHLVLKGRVKAINRRRGQERRFTEAEALRAINILRAGSISNVAELQKLANNTPEAPLSERSEPGVGLHMEKIR